MLDLDEAFRVFPVLETERLVLRELSIDDTAEVLRIMSDPSVLRYFGHLPMTSTAQAAEYITGVCTAFQERMGIRWAIIERASGLFVGTCSFWRLLKPHARAEVGYVLAPEWWGKGLMTEALATVLDFGFDRMKLHSVEAQIHPENTGSRRVLEKLGFAQEGYFRENYFDPVENRFTDTAVFSMLKTRWQARMP